MKIQCVLFDFDGVIFDSDKAVWRAANEILARYGIQQEPYESFRHRENNHWPWYRKRGVPLNEEKMRELFSELFDTSECGLVDGITEVLQQTARFKIPCGIVSSHPQNNLICKLKTFEIGDYFRYVEGGAYKKSGALRRECRRLSVAPTKTLYIGDMLSDVQDGNAAKMATVLFAPSNSPHASEAKYHISDIRDLLEIL